MKSSVLWWHDKKHQMTREKKRSEGKQRAHSWWWCLPASQTFFASLTSSGVIEDKMLPKSKVLEEHFLAHTHIHTGTSRKIWKFLSKNKMKRILSVYVNLLLKLSLSQSILITIFTSWIQSGNSAGPCTWLCLEIRTQDEVTIWRSIIVPLKGWKSSNIWEQR